MVLLSTSSAAIWAIVTSPARAVRRLSEPLRETVTSILRPAVSVSPPSTFATVMSLSAVPSPLSVPCTVMLPPDWSTLPSATSADASSVPMVISPPAVSSLPVPVTEAAEISPATVWSVLVAPEIAPVTEILRCAVSVLLSLLSSPVTEMEPCVEVSVSEPPNDPALTLPTAIRVLPSATSPVMVTSPPAVSSLPVPVTEAAVISPVTA